MHPTEAKLSDTWAGAPGYKHILQLTQAVSEEVKDQVQLGLQKYPQTAGNRQLEELSAARYRLLRLALLKN